ncbi:MAG: class I SAM-dependent methyltransferase [Lachnospiraceae bacterium]|nr:class I SAM-dependent methyltransferase [Lachnospiraceae bacterium]
MEDYSYEILDLLKKYDGDTAAALCGECAAHCLYAFSPLRENLFEWIEFGCDARVLQLGSDYGSYTGLLARRAKTVVVLDSRDENLEVNRLRHGPAGNVRYVRGDLLEKNGSQQATAFAVYKPQAPAFETVKELLEEPFDYVFSAGLLGQCKKEEASLLLSRAADFLKPGGTLFAAAENEAGVRYWMGAQALETAFLEVEFRGLFESLARERGGMAMLYYPVPDYRYPTVLYSDKYLPKTGDVTNISARLDGPGFWFGSEEEAMTKACRNGEFTKFANSFLGMYKKAEGGYEAD